MTKEQAKQILKDNKLAVTENRVNIIDCLDDGNHFHAISEIAEHVGNINTKSIYNNIKALIEVGLVDAYSFGGVSKYALTDNISGHNEIHLVHEGHVHHQKVDEKIFEQIKKTVEDSGKEVKSIKVYVDIK